MGAPPLPNLGKSYETPNFSVTVPNFARQLLSCVFFSRWTRGPHRTSNSHTSCPAITSYLRMAPWRRLDRPSSSRGGDVCDHRGQQTHVGDECPMDKIPSRLLSNRHSEGQHALEDVLQIRGARVERFLRWPSQVSPWVIRKLTSHKTL